MRKNAADIQMAVDAMELAFTRDFVSTFVIVSGDSDFTPLVSKLRELNKRVIGVGLKGSTSAKLPPACDEFLFYDRLEGAPLRQGSSSPGPSRTKKKTTGSRGGRGSGAPKATETETDATLVDAGSDRPRPTPTRRACRSRRSRTCATLERQITRTLRASSPRSTGGSIQASNLKRALLRKDPTFSEQDFGFRGFRELLRHLEEQRVITLTEGTRRATPRSTCPAEGRDEDAAFALLRGTVKELMEELGGDPPLSGLKDQLRKRQPEFSEKDLGYSGFLQFCKAAVAKNVGRDGLGRGRPGVLPLRRGPARRGRTVQELTARPHDRGHAHRTSTPRRRSGGASCPGRCVRRSRPRGCARRPRR